MNTIAAQISRITDTNEIQFPKLGWKFHIDPTAFTVFGIDIQWYGIIITLGLVLALVYCFPKMRRFGLDSDRTVDAVIGGVLGGIVGARVYYVIWKWSDYKMDTFGETVKAVVNTRNGGLAIYGGLIGALGVGLLICKFRKVKFLPMLDITVLGFLIGQGVGRWGNFVNQEAFGTNTNFFLGMTGGRIQDTIINETQMGGDMYSSGLVEMMWEKAVHPCFLYESLWCILGFVLLSWYSKRRKYDGQIFLMYLAWYGAERLVVEGLRTDSLYIGHIRVSQALSAVILVVSVIMQIVMFSKVHRDPESYVLYANTEEAHRLIEESRRKRMGLSVEDARAHGSDGEDDISVLDDDDDDDFEDDDLDDDDTDDDDIDDEPSGSTILGDDDEDEAVEDSSEADNENDDENKEDE